MTPLFSAPSVSYGQSAQAVRLPAGTPVFRDGAGRYWPANASDPSRSPAIGMVAISSTQNYTVGVVGAGFVTLNNWIGIVGAQSLTQGASYYMAATAGMLTTNPAEPGALIQQLFGVAVSVGTMQILANVASSPPGGLTLTIGTIETLDGASWTLAFRNGLLITATHHAAPVSALVIDDGSGGFWRLAVDTDGNLGAESTSGPASTVPVLADSDGIFWRIVVDTVGNRGAELHAGPATAAIILADSGGGQWRVVVDTAGNLGTTQV